METVDVQIGRAIPLLGQCVGSLYRYTIVFSCCHAECIEFGIGFVNAQTGNDSLSGGGSRYLLLLALSASRQDGLDVS